MLFSASNLNTYYNEASYAEVLVVCKDLSMNLLYMSAGLVDGLEGTSCASWTLHKVVIMFRH